MSAIDHQDIWLFRWVEYAASHGASPVTLEVDGAGIQSVGRPLQANLLVTNSLDVPLPVVLSGSFDTPVSVSLNVRGAQVSGDIPQSALILPVPPESSMSIDLSDYYRIVEEGPQNIRGYVRLSAGDHPVGAPLGNSDGTLWRYEAVPPTAVDLRLRFRFAHYLPSPSRAHLAFHPSANHL